MRENADFYVQYSSLNLPPLGVVYLDTQNRSALLFWHLQSLVQRYRNKMSGEEGEKAKTEEIPGKDAYTLITKSVPRDLEIIFFSLDYESFKTCKEVSNSWNKLLTSESFKKMGKSVFREDIERELHQASEDGNLKELRSILSSGMADVNCIGGRDDATPLHYASTKGHREVVKLLLDRGADPNKHDNVKKKGWTPLHESADEGHKDVVRLLLDAGAEPNKAALRGWWTPLSFAACKGHRDVVELLLHGGAEPNQAGMMAGWTPLHDASFFGHTAVVQLLLINGADQNIATEDGITPLSVALFNDHVSIVDILQGGKKSGEEKPKTAETLGKDAYKRKEYDAAIDHYKEAIRVNPREVAYPHLVAKVKFDQKEYGECIEYCRKAIKVGKENKGDVNVVAKAYVLRGRARIEAGEPDRGREDIEKAVTFLYKIANVKFENSILDVNDKNIQCIKFCDRAVKIAKENVVDLDLMRSVLLLKNKAMAIGTLVYEIPYARTLSICQDFYDLKTTRPLSEYNQYMHCFELLEDLYNEYDLPIFVRCPGLILQGKALRRLNGVDQAFEKKSWHKYTEETKKDFIDKTAFLISYSMLEDPQKAFKMMDVNGIEKVNVKDAPQMLVDLKLVQHSGPDGLEQAIRSLLREEK